jgi:hypothetical protein
MKKSLLVLALFGVLGTFSQPANAQSCMINGIATPFLIFQGQTSCCPAAPIASPCCPAAPVCNSCCPAASTNVEAIPIKKEHWWNLKRTGYRAICPGANCGCAAPIDQCGNPVQSVEPVLIPKKHFWESDKVQMMPFCPSSCCPAAPIAPCCH